MSTEVTVRFESGGRTVRVACGTSLLDAARMAGVALDARCGGSARCGGCRVLVAGEVSAPTDDERALLGPERLAVGVRLACRTLALGTVVVTHDASGDTLRVSFDGSQSTADGAGARLGAAVDIGTTSVAVSVVDLETGAEVGRDGALNAQAPFGADVLTRVAYARAGGAEELRRVIVGQVGRLLLEALGATADPRRLEKVVVVGNTAMTGLFLGRDVAPLAEAPYRGAHTHGETRDAASLGMEGLAGTTVRVLPGVSAFVGADVVAGLAASGLDTRSGIRLFIDLGTNGEIVLIANGTVLATATAAGPALEGGALTAGMRAEDGAIERVASSGAGLTFGVIGGGTPRGICGSGVFDLLAVLLDAGVLDEGGRMLAEEDGSGTVDAAGTSPLIARVAEREAVRAFMLHPDVWFTQLDVRQAQLAIAAVRTGVDLLLSIAGVRSAEVSEVVVAGGFGAHLDPVAAARTGLLPPALAHRMVFGGNMALAGARAALLGGAARTSIETLAGTIRVVNLASSPEFDRRFMATLGDMFRR